MAKIPKTIGGDLVCEVTQLGSVVSFPNGSVVAKCRTPVGIPAPLPKQIDSNALQNLLYMNWILSSIFGEFRSKLQNLSVAERHLLSNYGGIFTHPVTEERVKVKFSLPTTDLGGPFGPGFGRPPVMPSGSGGPETAI